MSELYPGIFGPYITSLIASKRAGGYRYDSAAHYLSHFDRYCSVSAASAAFSRDLVLGWAKAKEGESPATHRVRLSVVRELGKHMQALGVVDAFVLPSALHRKVDRHVPHLRRKSFLPSSPPATDSNLEPPCRRATLCFRSSSACSTAVG